MPTLILTALLTLITIVIFGDSESDISCPIEEHGANYGTSSSNEHETNDTTSKGSSSRPKVLTKRGTGIVMGSHLVPILYASTHLFLGKVNCGESQSTCLIDTYNSTSMVHLKLALLGGLSFAVSNLYTKCHHCMHESSRLRYMPSMQLTSTIYMILLVSDLTVSKWIIQNQQYDYILTVAMNLLHMIIMSRHSISHSWHNSFTPGEWMAVSTIITSTIVEFILQYLTHTRAVNLPEPMAVAHAGLSGCILGIVSSNLLQKILNESKQSVFASLVVVVAITVGCLEFAMDAITSSKASIGHSQIPLSIHWLINFLYSEPNNHVFKNNNLPPSRVMILLYWTAVLATALPVSIYIASWTTSCGTQKQKRRVVIARKYFHLVAILLFAPITWLDRDMMCLSYAIAVALMLVIEMVRFSTPQCEESGTITTLSSVAFVNQFYTIFFDEKDSSGGIVVSHIALIVGCACPLWIHQFLQYHSELDANSINWRLLSLLPYLGVLVLGIGDSAGAIGGLSFANPTRWLGGSSRTLEGSVCMFTTMLCFIGLASIMSELDYWKSMTQFVLPLFALTMIEASTKQNDNICLPIAASTLAILAISS